MKKNTLYSNYIKKRFNVRFLTHKQYIYSLKKGDQASNNNHKYDFFRVVSHPALCTIY